MDITQSILISSFFIAFFVVGVTNNPKTAAMLMERSVAGKG